MLTLDRAAASDEAGVSVAGEVSELAIEAIGRLPERHVTDALVP
jgi:hypothetical protein